MNLQPNPHAMKSGDILSKEEVVQLPERLSGRGVIEIWKRCVARWRVNHDSTPTAFLEMSLFIEELEDRI